MGNVRRILSTFISYNNSLFQKGRVRVKLSVNGFEDDDDYAVGVGGSVVVVFSFFLHVDYVYIVSTQ